MDDDNEEDARLGPLAPRNVPPLTAPPRLLACSWWEHATSLSSDVDASRALRLFDIVEIQLGFGWCGCGGMYG